MPVEKIDGNIVVVYKEIFNVNKHTDYYAIDHSDIELMEYLFEDYHYTYDCLKSLLIYSINYNNLNMIKCIVKFTINKYSYNYENGLNDMIDDLIKQAEFSCCTKDIIDYLKELD